MPYAGEFQQALHPVAVPGVRLQQFLGRVVVGLLADQGPPDAAGDVVVAQAHRVGVAVGPLPHLRARPAPDAGHRAQPGVGVRRAERALEAGRHPRGPLQGHRPGMVDRQLEPFPRRDRPRLLGGGGQPQPQIGARPGGRDAVPADQPALRTDVTGEHGAPVRRAAGAEAARVMADLIAEGARTGMANVVTGVLFLAAMFLTPLAKIVPTEVAAAALVVVGAMMMTQIKGIDLAHFDVALPVFLTITVMPFTYSIANGIGAGFVSWLLIHVLSGRAKQVHWLLWVVAAGFVLYFARGPVEALLGS